jgi:hypothetical protein
MYNLLSGNALINSNNYLFKTMLVDNLYFSLFNRKDNGDNSLSWGDSVLVKVEETDGDFQVDDLVKLHNDLSKYRFKIINISDDKRWILINMIDSNSELNVFKLNSDIATKEYWLDNGVVKKKISKITTANSYYLNIPVRLVSIDYTSKDSGKLDFGDLILRKDDIGTLTLYNMNLNTFLTIEDNTLSNITYDICEVFDKKYIPILKDIKFVAKKEDCLIFEYVWNNTIENIIVTTKKIEVDYSLFVDVDYRSDTFISLNTDTNMKPVNFNYYNDLELSGSLQATNLQLITGYKFCKEVFYNDDIEWVESQTLVLENNNRNCFFKSGENNTLYIKKNIRRFLVEVDKIKYTLEDFTETIDTIGAINYNISEDVNGYVPIPVVTGYTSAVPTMYGFISKEGFTTQSYTINTTDIKQYTYDNDLFEIGDVIVANGLTTISFRAGLNPANYFIDGSEIFIEDENEELKRYTIAIDVFEYSLGSAYEGNNVTAKAYSTRYNISNIALYVKSLNSRLYLISEDINLIKKYNLTDLMLSFTYAVGVEDEDFRQMGIFYNNSVDNPVYLSENIKYTLAKDKSYDFNIII